MVNVQEYQIVATGTTPEAAESAYLQLLMESGTITADDGQALIEKTQAEGTLAEIRTAVLEGNTYYFLRLEGEDVFYSISAAQCSDVVIMNVGDAVTISYAPTETGSILDAYSVAWTDKPSGSAWQAPQQDVAEAAPAGETEETEPVL